MSMRSQRQPALPPLSDLLHAACNDDVPASDPALLENALSLLFEPSPALHDALVPQLQQHLHLHTSDRSGWPPKSYAAVVDCALAIVHGWTWEEQAAFVGGHARIGEVHGLSAMSTMEQGQTVSLPTPTPSTHTHSVALAPAPTPPDVLARLAFLNACYERRYPGLVYITFVDGRSRAQIRDEMERKFVEDGMLVSMDWEGNVEDITPREVPSSPWIAEVERAVCDVGKIAKSRLGKLGRE